MIIDVQSAPCFEPLCSCHFHAEQLNTVEQDTVVLDVLLTAEYSSDPE